MMPPMKGPNAGPIRVPLRNQPIAVARSVGLYMSLRKVSTYAYQERGTWTVTHARQAEPTRMNAVPSNAVRIRKTKKAARFGASAVPMLQPQKSTDVI